MSDIMSSGGRAANGGARPQGPKPVLNSPATVSRSAVIPPTEIMRRREERAKAQQEQARATNEEQRRRLQSEWDEYDNSAAGVAAPPTSVPQQPVSQPIQAPQASHRRTQSAAIPTSQVPATAPTAATSIARPSAQAGFTASPGGPSQAANAPPSATQVPPQATSANRPRASTTRQTRPVQATAGPSGTARPPQSAQAQAQRAAAAAALSAGAAQQTPEMRAERERIARESGIAPTEASGRRVESTASSFPHAFERWEMLSSKWEGMTSHWISRLQMNSEELQNQPMLAQLSRQVTDLSAAGANLFTALVELQRLRASSERKFQRWFHDTRNEMERQQELVGQLERALIQERRDRADDQANWEKLVEGARRTEVNFSRLDNEKNRELQIAKDESRRAWEELGRYEALERERQKALAQGLPVEIGGYTVYPRLFPESRQGSVSQGGRAGSRDNMRPTSRRGPQTSLSVQDDPFVADMGAGDSLQDHSDGQPWSPSQATAGAGLAQMDPASGRYTQASAPTTTTSALSSYGTTAGYTSFSSPPGPATSGPFYSQANAQLYNPSEEELEYERDEHGNILTDETGRPLSYRRGLHEARSSESEGDNGPFTTFTNDPAEAQARRRIPATSAQAMSAAQSSAGPASTSMQTRPDMDFEFYREDDEDDAEQRYTGAGYGSLEPEDSQHYHPTRLSDVPEEDEISRASEAGASRGIHGAPF